MVTVIYLKQVAERNATQYDIKRLFTATKRSLDDASEKSSSI